MLKLIKVIFALLVVLALLVGLAARKPVTASRVIWSRPERSGSASKAASPKQRPPGRAPAPKS